VDILNSALLEVYLTTINSTENSEEITDGKYDEFRDDNELLLAEVCYMIAVTSVEDDGDEKNWEELHNAFQ
jgi:hypothetical protein